MKSNPDPRLENPDLFILDFRSSSKVAPVWKDCLFIYLIGG